MPPRIKSLSELRKELQVRERALDKFRVRRDQLAARLEKLDRLIAEMEGGNGRRGRAGGARAAVVAAEAKPTRRRRRATGTPLTDYIRKVLQGEAQGMRARDIATKVVEAGYPTRSRDFYGIVAAALRDPKSFKRLSRGVYKLA